MKVVVRHLALFPFEEKNTKLLSVISRLPYSKLTKVLSQPLVELRRIRSGTTRSSTSLPHLPFGFKPTLILNHAIIWLDDHTPCINSSDDSYCSSELTRTTHIAQALNSFFLQCYPRYSRSNDIPIACSSSTPCEIEPQSH